MLLLLDFLHLSPNVKLAGSNYASRHLPAQSLQ